MYCRISVPSTRLYGSVIWFAIVWLAVVSGRVLAEPPTIHVEWDDQQNQPAPNFDYFVMTNPPGSPDFPNVELNTGNLAWRVWSRDPDNLYDLGDIGLIFAYTPSDFGLTVKGGEGNSTGARHTKGIHLIPSSPANFGQINGANFQGDLLGDVVVQRASTGDGGIVSLFVEGTTFGNVMLPRAGLVDLSRVAATSVVDISEIIYTGYTGVVIGELHGAIHIGVMKGNFLLGDFSSGSVQVDQIAAASPPAVPPIFKTLAQFAESSSIVIGDIVGPAILQLDASDPASLEFAGSLRLESGLKTGQVLNTAGVSMTSSGVVDFNGREIAGTVEVHGGGIGNLINGGVLTGTVELGNRFGVPPNDIQYPFGGTASFAGVEGVVRVPNATDLFGLLQVTGAVTGTIHVDGGAYGTIRIGGALAQGAALSANGELGGVVGLGAVDGSDVNGQILADADGLGRGTITAVVTVAGLFNGNICDADLCDMVCGAGLTCVGGVCPGPSSRPPLDSFPSNFQFLGGLGGDAKVCGERPCAAPLNAVVAADPPDGDKKNRFISFRALNSGLSTALRMTLPDGTQRWVGPPQDVCERSGVVTPTNPPCTTSTFKAAKLQCAPYYTDWEPLGTIHVYSQGIVPGGAYPGSDPENYTVDVIMDQCNVATATNFSPEAVFQTSKYGDTIGETCQQPPSGLRDTCKEPDGTVRVTADVLAALEKFRNAPLAPMKVRVDVDPAEPDLIVNITDVVQILRAFQGYPYPFEVTAPCN